MTKFRQSTFTLVLAAALGPVALWGHEYGPDPRYTAAPGDDPNACSTATCHTSSRTGGPINAAGGGVKVTFSSGTSYTPGVAVTMTVTTTDPVNTHNGFQLTARLESNLANGQAGDFTAGTNQLVLCDNGAPKTSKGCPANALVQFIEHSFPQGTHVGVGPYTFTWMPPATNVGNVHIYVAGNAVNNDLQADGNDHVYTNSYVLTPAAAAQPPKVTTVNSGTDFGGMANFAPGTWLEIKGTNLAPNTRTWAGSDFTGSNAPTSLDGISASVDGKPAFVYYISPTQINVQAPADTSVGPVGITVTNPAGTSPPVTAQLAKLVPGMLAPASFDVGGKQYMVALFQDGVTYVGNTGLIAGVPFRPAKPGDSITAYGIGFGDVTPAIAPGVVVSQANQLSNSFSLMFGSTAATLQYFGLAPSFVGLYQFNIVVPNVANGDVPISVAVGGVAAQTGMFLTVHD